MGMPGLEMWQLCILTILWVVYIDGGLLPVGVYLDTGVLGAQVQLQVECLHSFVHIIVSQIHRAVCHVTHMKWGFKAGEMSQNWQHAVLYLLSYQSSSDISGILICCFTQMWSYYKWSYRRLAYILRTDILLLRVHSVIECRCKATLVVCKYATLTQWAV